MKWSTFKRELYAIQQAVRHFLTDFDGRHLVIFTDHKAILGAFQSPSSQAYDPIAAAHLAEIAQWTSDVRFIDGKSNAVADWLSRPPHVPLGLAYQPPTEDVANINLEIINHKAMAQDQLMCPDLKAHRQNKLPNSNIKLVEFSPGVDMFCQSENGTDRQRDYNI